MQRFVDRNILVTGGAMGIGRATAERLAAEGATVYLADVDETVGAEAVAEIAAKDQNALFFQVDLSREPSIVELGRSVAAVTTVLHGLVNCAGIYRTCSLAKTGDADWHQQIDINLRAPALCVRELLPLLKKGPGHIVNLSSEGAFRPYAERWVYDATKAGVIALTRNCAVEFVEYGIRANTVAPGWTVTEMHFRDAPDPAARKKELEEYDMQGAIMRRLGRPEEMAAAIAFLLSDDAAYITATTLHVDGGRVAY